MDRCVWAPQRLPGGMESEPKESLSMRVGRAAMASRMGSSLPSVGGRMVERMPGVKVAGAKTCFIVDDAIAILLLVLDLDCEL